MSISRKTLSNPVLVLIVFVLLGIMGLFTFRKVAVNLMPDISFPYLLIYTTYANAGPQSVENAVTKVLEDGLVSVNKLKKMTSVSSEGTSAIMLEFYYGTNLDAATNEVRDSIDSVKETLPKSVKAPSIMKMNMNSDPIMYIAIRGNRSADEIRFIADNEIKDILSQANGVGQVSVAGGRTQIVRVELSQNRLAAYGLTLSFVASKLALENIELGGGKITEGIKNFVIRTTGEYQSVEEISNTVISTANGYNIHLSDIGRAFMGYEDTSSEVFINGNPGVYVAVTKQSGANVVKVANSVYEKMDEIRKSLPSDIHFDIMSDDTTYIRSTLHTLFTSAWQGLLLAVFILFVFLKNFKSTFIISISIPMSIIITLLFMNMTGISLNIMTLTGLILGVGMVVDASVVMIENIYTYRIRGAKPKTAAILGSQEMMMSVISGNMTTIAVFLPFLLYMKDLDFMGQMFKDLIFTIVIALVVSLFVAMFLVPVLAGKFLPLTNRNEVPVRNPVLKGLYELLDRMFDALTNRYRNVLKAALAHRKTTVVVSLLILGGSLAIVPTLHINLLPDTDENLVTLAVTMPVGTSLEKTTTLVRKLETIARNEIQGYKTITTSVGAADNYGSSAATYKGALTVYLPTLNNQIDTSTVVKKKLRSHFGEFAGAELAFNGDSMESVSGSDIDVVVRSQNMTAALAVASQVQAAMETIKDISDIKKDTETGLPQIEICIDRQRAYSFGVSIEAAATEISHCIAGVTAGKYRSNGKEYDISLRYRDSDKQQVIDLDAIQVQGTNGLVSLSNFATVKKGFGPVEIRRENRSHTIHITASILSKVNANIIEEKIQKKLASSYIIPGEVVVSYEGSWKKMKKQGTVYLQIIVLAIVLVYGVMAGTYGSFKAPLINMMTIPFMFIGVILIYKLSGQSLSIMTAVGLIMLVGIVVNNGIILVDYTNLLIDRGHKVKEACLLAGTSRLRPVLITTATTILGMLPMSFSTEGSAALVQPIGLSIVGGLTSSTFITLFFIPVLYSLLMKEKQIEKSKICIPTLPSIQKAGSGHGQETLYRCDIIANQSVQEDIIELLEENIYNMQYTLHPSVYGRGIRNCKFGTATWPEINFELYTYVTSQNLAVVQAVVTAVKNKFPEEGIQLFVIPLMEDRNL